MAPTVTQRGGTMTRRRMGEQLRGGDTQGGRRNYDPFNLLSDHSHFQRSMKIEQWLEAFQMLYGLSLESDFSDIPFLFSPLPFFELSLQ